METEKKEGFTKTKIALIVATILFGLATIVSTYTAVTYHGDLKKSFAVDTVLRSEKAALMASLVECQQAYRQAHQADSAKGVAIDDMDIIQQNYDQLQLPTMWIGACNSRQLQRIHCWIYEDLSWLDLRSYVTDYFGARYPQIKSVLSAAPGLLLGVMNNPKNKSVLEWIKKNVFNGYDMSEDMVPYLQGTNKKYDVVFLGFFNDHSKKPHEGCLTDCEGWEPFTQRFWKQFPNDCLDEGKQSTEKLLSEYKNWRSAHVLPMPARTAAIQMIRAYNALGK